MTAPILVLNAGSSSIKFSVFESAVGGALRAAAHGQVEGIGGAAHLEVADADGRSLADEPVAKAGFDAAIGVIHNWCARHYGGESSFAGVGHRIVHGGRRYAAPALIDLEVIAELERLIPLAPLHQPTQIAAIRAVAKVAPTLRQVACFDTAFHRAQPALAQAFALPRELTDRGIHRYGFHGLSYEYIVGALPAVAPECARGRLVIAHLGSGASLCAVHQGRSVATTMGMTPLDGVPMGTRTGTLDPGVVLYLMQHERMPVPEIERLLYQRSGLLGVSGLSPDMRTLEASATPAAKEAIDLFVYRIGRELGSLAAALGGVDALIFTAGIGEHDPRIRARVCQDARWLGIELDAVANDRGGPRISMPGSRASAWVMPTDENLMIARHTRALLEA